MCEFERERGLALSGQPWDMNQCAGLPQSLAEVGEFFFAADEDRRADRQVVHGLWGRRLLGQQKRADFAKALRLIFAQVEVSLVAQERRDSAVAVQHAQQFRLAVVRLVPECVRPLFFDPVGIDRVGREDQDDEVGIEAVGDAGDDVLAWGDFAFVQPDFDQAVPFQEAGELADEGLVFARMAEKDGNHGEERLF